MKGVVFNILEEMVVEHFGMQVWNDILDTAETEGVYTAGQSYPDEQLFELVGIVCKKLNMSSEMIIGSFGEYMFHRLHDRHPSFIEKEPTLKSFLKSIESVIHVEVRKLYQDPNLPSFEYFDQSDDHLIMRYHSPRKLCILAEGLIRGASSHYAQKISLTHTTCMHKNDPHCDLEITFHHD